MRGNITKRGRSSWRLKCNIARDPRTRKQATRFNTYRGTKKEAEAELTRLINGANLGNYVDPSAITVSEFFERWDRDWASIKLGPKSLERYRSIISAHIRPRI